MHNHSEAKRIARLIFANWMATIPEACEICRKREKQATPKGYFWGVIYPGPDIIDHTGGPITMALPNHLYDRLRESGITEVDVAPPAEKGVYTDFGKKLNYILQRSHEMLR